jgi:hypothetical protein
VEYLFLAWFDQVSSNFFFLVVPSLAGMAAMMLGILGRPKYVGIPILLLLSYIAAHVVFIWRADDVHRWVAQTGQSGELVLSRMEETGNTINDQQEMRWLGSLKLADGQIVPYRIPTHSLRMWPRVEPYMPPLQKVLPIRYRPSYPDLVVVTLPNAADAQRCVDIAPKLQEISARILLLQGNERTAAEKQRDALLAELSACASGR